MSDEQDRQAAIARLIANGKMTQEKAGLHVAEHVTDEDRETIPDYDPAVVRERLPHVLEMRFDEDEEGCFVFVEDGKLGEEVRVPLGADPPPTTEELIATIQRHYAGQLDNEKLDKARAAFAAFGEDD